MLFHQCCCISSSGLKSNRCVFEANLLMPAGDSGVFITFDRTIPYENNAYVVAFIMPTGWSDISEGGDLSLFRAGIAGSDDYDSTIGSNPIRKVVLKIGSVSHTCELSNYEGIQSINQPILRGPNGGCTSPVDLCWSPYPPNYSPCNWNLNTGRVSYEEWHSGQYYEPKLTYSAGDAFPGAPFVGTDVLVDNISERKFNQQCSVLAPVKGSCFGTIFHTHTLKLYESSPNELWARLESSGRTTHTPYQQICSTYAGTETIVSTYLQEEIHNENRPTISFEYFGAPLPFKLYIAAVYTRPQWSKFDYNNNGTLDITISRVFFDQNAR